MDIGRGTVNSKVLAFVERLHNGKSRPSTAIHHEKGDATDKEDNGIIIEDKGKKRAKTVKAKEKPLKRKEPLKEPAKEKATVKSTKDAVPKRKKQEVSQKDGDPISAAVAEAALEENKLLRQKARGSSLCQKDRLML